ncbi:unnamed protein product [Oikopleura dioica]|uniref:EGF-like domain-containing protein n=1 Tax=Oikopleura dioica TaxID=34765 RepID=E4YQH1_OIKDI|nr:unnamed protein product [Oikopleura dioica]
MIACSPNESRSRMIFEETTSTELPDTTTPEDTTTLPPTTSTTSTTQKIPIEQLTAATFGKVLDLSGGGNRGRVRDPLVKFPGPVDETSREVFVNYDTDGNSITGFSDTMDPEIEYIEADGVFMFYLDYMQNPERHCNDNWPADLTSQPMGLDNCQDTDPFVQPDMFPDTPYNEMEPKCDGVPGDCTDENCCNVHRGLNYTRAVCKCREYGGDIATPYSQVQDQYMFDFIQSIWEYRFNVSNPRYCRNADGSVPGTLNTPDCPIIQEGLTTATWGNELVWIGYNFNSDASKYQLVNGTLMNLDYHYWGLIGTGIEGRKRRALDDINVVDATQMIITIDNTHIDGGADIVIDYDDNAPVPICIGIRYDSDDTDPLNPVNKLQWVERDCDRAKSVMCEVDLRVTQSCRFGNIPEDDENYDELTKITTDAWSASPDPCTNWQKCEGGEIVNGTCLIDEKFDTVLRMCMPAITQEPCNINECNVTAHVCTGANMHCEDTIGSYACICDPGYQWNPEKSDPTADNPDGREPSPDNNFWVWPEGGLSPGDVGFVHDDSGLYDAGLGDMCIDLDECLANEFTCPGNSECSNLNIVLTGRPYECVCSTGYTPVYDITQNTTDANGVNYYDVVSCEDVNECDWGNVTCSSVTMCVNTDGSFNCGCEVGYTTDPSCNACIGNATADGFSTDPDLCAIETADAGISNCCGNINECESPILNLCPVNSDCIDNDGSFFCDCHDDMDYINTDNYICEDKDECSNATWNGCDPNSVCENLDPSYICECNDGYDNCANPDCIDLDECLTEEFNECDGNGTKETEGPKVVRMSMSVHRIHVMLTLYAQTMSGALSANVRLVTKRLHLCRLKFANADCVNDVGTYTCTCKTGYTGHGEFCADINECDDPLTNGCDPLAECANTDASYTCTCPDGYDATGSPAGASCDEIDECAEITEPCDAEATCTNYPPGSFTCTCNAGYSGNGAIGNCTTVNECTDNLHNCDPQADCTDTEGSFDCTCIDGYYSLETPPGRSGDCLDVNEFSCACNAGFVGDGLTCSIPDECADQTHNCDPRAECTKEPGQTGFTCNCTTGYTDVMTPDGLTFAALIPGLACTDIDECDIMPSVCTDNALCTNTVGSYSCGCDDGFQGPDPDTCEDINECDSVIAPCAAVATCSNNPGSFTCACPTGYSGNGFICEDIDECRVLPDTGCDDGANCINSPGSFSCECRSGYDSVNGTGVTGDCTPKNECLDSPYGYQYIPNINFCQDINECNEAPCTAGAVCTNNDPGFDCNCDTGFVQSNGISSCNLTTSICVNTFGGHLCYCKPEYADDGFGNCVDKNECDLGLCPFPSSPNGTDLCVNFDGGYQCFCPDGFDGNVVVTPIANECVELVGEDCPVNSQCSNLLGGVSCACDPGYENNQTDSSLAPICVNINECVAGHLCLASATCVDLDGSYMCQCPTGYQGDGVNFCEDADECAIAASNPCDPTAICLNTDGSYTCQCPLGNMEDPDTRECLDVDECASGTHNCMANEFCLNFDGSHSCFELPTTTAQPLMEGDPHIRVSAPHEEPVCFDVSDTDKSVLSIISEGAGGVQVNGQVFEEGTKGKVCRLETVGIVSPGGVQVAVYVDQVTIGREGQVYERFYYDRAAEHGMDDVHIEVHPADRGKNPHRGVMISIGHAGDIRFNVEYKRAKKSASLAVERGSGLKDRLSGVLGSTMHGDIDYHISKSGGIVLPNGKEIPVTMVNWNVHHKCHKMEASMVEDFLGHAISEYRVEGLFGAPSETTTSWISTFFDVFGFPKRR